MSHLVRREQRIARRIALVVAILVVAVGAPLLFYPGLRLRVGYELGLAPGKNAERLFGPDAPVELVILAEDVPVDVSLPYRRFTALYVAERTGSEVVLHDLASGRLLTLPLAKYSRISASDDRSALLFVDDEASTGTQAVLVTIATGDVRPLPPGETDPRIPGNWSADIFPGGIGCDGVSPDDHWIACIRHSRGSVGLGRFIFGDWELKISPFGRPEESRGLYRGRGSDPIGGWSADESTIYLQNETGIWRVDV
jgi:hypothetical protein